MKRPDRVGALVIAITIFGFYWTLANFLYLFGVASFPLGTADFVPFMMFDVTVLILFVIRQMKRAETSPNPQK